MVIYFTSFSKNLSPYNTQFLALHNNLKQTSCTDGWSNAQLYFILNSQWTKSENKKQITSQRSNISRADQTYYILDARRVPSLCHWNNNELDLIDGLENTIEAATSACNFSQPLKLISLSCAHFSTMCFTFISVISHNNILVTISKHNDNCLRSHRVLIHQPLYVTSSRPLAWELQCSFTHLHSQ